MSKTPEEEIAELELERLRDESARLKQRTAFAKEARERMAKESPPLVTAPANEDPEAARRALFWSLVSKDADGHWRWRGLRYGQSCVFLWAGHETTAARAAWELIHGPVPAGRRLRRQKRDCTIPDCVNPAHWYLPQRG
jgi:hypothetical protein